jgi:hypothetical protein
LILLIFSAFALISGLLGDFILPSLALEGTTLAEAFRRMGQLIRQEPGEFFLYALLKTVLGGAAYLGVIIAFEIVLLIVVLILFLAAALIGFLLHLAGVPPIVLTFLRIFLLFAFEIFFIGYALLLAIGPVLTFLDAYALYFLGGRYPMLGDLLDRSTPPPAYAYAAAFPYPPPPGTGLTP